jgi:enamine deaminase RidA (YjgF/YER057c/UK114 family)
MGVIVKSPIRALPQGRANAVWTITSSFMDTAHVAARTVEVAPGSRWIAITATPAIDADGTAASGVMEQAAVAWTNLERALEAAKYTRNDLVSITQYVTSAAGAPACERVCIDRLDGVRPACKLIVVAGLTYPDHQVLIEAWAAKGHPHLHPTEVETASAADHRSRTPRHLRAGGVPATPERGRPCPATDSRVRRPNQAREPQVRRGSQKTTTYHPRSRRGLQAPLMLMNRNAVQAKNSIQGGAG